MKPIPNAAEDQQLEVSAYDFASPFKFCDVTLYEVLAIIAYANANAPKTGQQHSIVKIPNPIEKGKYMIDVNEIE